MANVTFIVQEGSEEISINLDAKISDYTQYFKFSKIREIKVYTHDEQELDINKTFHQNGVKADDILVVKTRLKLFGRK